MKNDYGYDLNDDFIYIRIKKYNPFSGRMDEG